MLDTIAERIKSIAEKIADTDTEVIKAVVVMTTSALVTAMIIGAIESIREAGSK